ncbi:Protein N-acetyltransferase, RimJ/RimL family [Bradyrhizobium sp. Ghvi]|nr:Protein N-acetyltransferase, RimJ/RimL family [Bradyrhizobium sp. Ghvi]
MPHHAGSPMLAKIRPGFLSQPDEHPHPANAELDLNLVECILENEHVRLEPLSEKHREPLREATSADREIWTAIYPFSLEGDQFDPSWTRIQQDHKAGNWIPFAVIRSGRCVGLTSYIRPEAKYRSVDIGSTYYRPEDRGTVVNPGVKHLLLGHAFGCGANRVQFGVDALNLRSRRAMLKLGATEEGVLRRARTTWTGRVFDRVIFSILAEEWPRVRSNLDAQIAKLAA